MQLMAPIARTTLACILFTSSHRVFYYASLADWICERLSLWTLHLAAIRALIRFAAPSIVCCAIEIVGQHIRCWCRELSDGSWKVAEYTNKELRFYFSETIINLRDLHSILFWTTRANFEFNQINSQIIWNPLSICTGVPVLFAHPRCYRPGVSAWL